MAKTVKSPPAMQRPGFDPWIRKIPWRRKWQATPAFAWRIPWTEELGSLQSVGLQRVTHDLVTKHTHSEWLKMYSVLKFLKRAPNNAYDKAKAMCKFMYLKCKQSLKPRFILFQKNLFPLQRFIYLFNKYLLRASV